MTGPTMITGGQQALLYGQGLSFPPRVGPDGAMVWSTWELNVRESSAPSCAPGRAGGWSEPPGPAGWTTTCSNRTRSPRCRLIVEDVQQALTRYEPRIRLDDVTALLNPDDVRAVDITVSYTLVATGVAERLAMTLRSQG